ncbi:MAG: serine hydrolase [Patescibacteria group bacterium]
MRTKIVKIADVIAYQALKLEHLFKKLRIDKVAFCPRPDAYVIVDEDFNIVEGRNSAESLKHLASLNKALIARALLSMIQNRKVNPEDKMPVVKTTNYPWDLASDTVGGNIHLMLKKSSNTATNLLIDYVGGLDAINQELRRIGFGDTLLQSYTLPSSYEPTFQNQKSLSTPLELARALLDIYNSQDSLFIDPMVNTPYQYAHTDRLINKVAVKSDIFGNGSVFIKNGRVYCAVVFYNTFTQWQIKLFTLTSEILILQKSNLLIFKWDPISAFIQNFINSR